MKYRVLKEFVSPAGVLVTPDTPSIDDLSYPMMAESLLRNGFIEEIKNGPWKPSKDKETFWALSDNGEIQERKAEFEKYCDEHYTIDTMYEIGNIFQTKQQAEKAADWLIAFKVLRDDTKGFKPDWGDSRQTKWTAEYNHETKKLNVYWACFVSGGVPYFKSEEDVRRSVEKHKKEWLTFLGVEGEE